MGTKWERTEEQEDGRDTRMSRECDAISVISSRGSHDVKKVQNEDDSLLTIDESVGELRGQGGDAR